MAISCGRTAPNTTIGWLRASRCPVENLGRTNRSNGGNTSWQPRRKPPRKRNTKRTDDRSEIPQSLSREAPLERLFHSPSRERSLSESGAEPRPRGDPHELLG